MGICNNNPNFHSGLSVASGSTANGGDMSDYTAKNIKVLSDAASAKRFGYEKAQELSEIYPSTSKRFFETLVEACQLCNFDPDQAAMKYCEGYPVQLPVEFQEIFSDLMKERISKEQRS